MNTPQARYPWPTEPIIVAQWHDRDKATPGPARLYMKDASGDYVDVLAGTPRFKGGGHFIVTAAYVDATELNSRTAELRALQETLRTKNTKIKGYREALKLADRTGRRNAYSLGIQHGISQEQARTKRPHMHAQIYKKFSYSGLWLAEIRHGARGITWMVFPTWEEALAWANQTMKDLHEEHHH